MTIGITTFSKRFALLAKLVEQIRRINKHDKIIITVNGEKDGLFDDEYRKNILDLCSNYEHVYPIFFIEMRGLSKMWNTIITTSVDDNILLLNDDLEINNLHIFDEIHGHITSQEYNGFTRINRSFSHFIVNKSVIDDLGYFDERLLGFGEEDGDIYYRLIKNNMGIKDISINGFSNLISDIRHDHVVSGIGKYSLFNREYIYGQKYLVDETSNLKGMFDSPMKQIISDVNCYPLEKYHNENKNRV